MLEKESLELLKVALTTLEEGFDLPSVASDTDYEKMRHILTETAKKLQNNYPYFHPYYAGQMLKPPHPIARTAYMLAMWINPNNHALDGSRASSPMEKEVVGDLAAMFGYPQHLGHLTSSGTIANLEALWVSGQELPDKKIVASDQAHYTHERISAVLKIPFQKVSSDQFGRMDISALEAILKDGDVGTVVCTMGTTGLGTVEPLADLLNLKEKYNFRIHVDGAYGGYFKLLENLSDDGLRHYALIHKADSIVVDPHKHGLQPYGCGCVLFKDPNVARHYLHDSPYTYYTSNELHLGEISLECSRAGASAVGLWATHQLLPPVRGGVFAKELSKSRNAALKLASLIQRDNRFRLIADPETDIVVWTLAGTKTSQVNDAVQVLFDRAAELDIHLSLLKLPVAKAPIHELETDTAHITCLRSVLMKPEHDAWIAEIWGKLLTCLS